VRDDLNLPPLARKGISALLFNWDFDDATLKPGHQDWLDENVVPVLGASENTRIKLTGMASRKGDANYNLSLSNRRVETVKNYLQSKGAGLNQFDVSGVGENAAAALGKLDGTDDDEDRAVALEMTPPIRSGVTRFRRVNPLDKLDGFDQASTPQWLMMPADGFRRILQLVNGEAVRLVVGNPRAVKLVDPNSNRPVDELVVGEPFELIKFEGGLPGESNIFGFDLNGALLCHLQVTTLPKKDVSVAFHFVSDKKHKSTRDPKTIEDVLLKGANRVFNRQANIFVSKKSVDKVDFPTEDLGDEITKNTVGDKFKKLTDRGSAGVRANVFFVWEFTEIGVDGDVDARVDTIPGKNVVFEDDAGKDPDLSFAHEFGHLFGLVHTGTDDTSLRPRVMWDFTGERGGLLIKDEIIKANGLA
jgi:hypothetical protein